MRKAAQAVALACVLGLPALAAQRPDRDLYQDARKAQGALEASAKKRASRLEWERVILQYRRLVARYPQSPYCDDALKAAGDLYRAMGARFKSARYADEAADAYRTLAREYPSSSHAEPALYAVFELAQAAGERQAATDAARAYLAAFPDGGRAREVRLALRKRAPAQAASLPKAPPPGLARVFNLRFWSGDSSTRVVLDVERQVPIKYDRIGNPDRLWIDLAGARLHPNLSDRAFPVGDGLLSRIRIASNRDDVVRVVLDFRQVEAHSVFYLQDPVRLVVDVRGTPRAQAAQADPAAAPPAPTPIAATEPGPPAPLEAEAPETLPARTVDGIAAPPASHEPPRAQPQIVVESPAPAPPKRAASAERAPASPLPPQANRSGSYSLARQLGLGARRIVIDAGHGGHDPGTIGRAGLQEKDLVLDVALRLERLVRAELGAETVLTRAADVFIPLEERTAVANSRAADLFLSIHANASRNRAARGIETYFLNFAQNPHSESVAARENAISAATLKDLQNLVKAITLNSKIDESRDFASSVQEAMVTTLRPHYPRVVDRGVHTAPFYVLIGANMPSILAEIAFLSHGEEERLLRTPEYREMVARSLLAGVREYLAALNRTQMRRLTDDARPPRVASDGRR